jgi:PKD repeat protein
MKKMGVVGLLVFLLVMSISIPVSENSPAHDIKENVVEFASSPLSLSSQYDPDLVFQRGIVFDVFSNVTPCGLGPRDFELGDLNNDSFTDVAIISNVTNDIVIFNGTSSGEFNENPWRIHKADMVDLRDIAIGDLDGDGLNDFVVSHLTEGGASRLTIFYQTDDFVPGPSDTLMTDTQPFELVIGEFSGDSYNDIAVVCRGSPSSADDYVTVWKWPFLDFVDKTQVAIPGLTRSELLSLGRINLDDRVDLVVGNLSGPNTVILYQPASFISPINPWPTKTLIVVGAVTDVEIANLTGTGKRDLAVGNSGLSRVQFYYNTGSDLPNSWNTQVSTNPGVFSLAFGEISGDNHTDMVVLSSTGSNASVYFQGQNNDWHSTPNYTFPTNSGPVRALVNDTKQTRNDILVLSLGGASIEGGLEQFFAGSYLLGNANLNLFPYSSPSSLASGSVETNQTTIAATLPSSNEIAIYELNSQRKNRLLTENAPSDIDFGTFNADGGDDIVVANRLSNSVSVFLGSDSIYTQRYPFLNVTILPLTTPSCVVCTPLEQTSLDDILVGGNGGVVVLNNTGVSPFFDSSDFEVLSSGLSENVTEIYVGEFNGQGNGGDIAILTKNSSLIQLFFRNPTGSWNNNYPLFPSANLTAGPTSVLNSMALGDFDANGRMDICAVNRTARAFVFTQPIGGFTPWYPYDYSFDLYEPTTKVKSADMNDDGIADLVISCQIPAKVSIYLNHGAGVFTNNMNFTSGGTACDLVAEDMNGDGRVDFASCAAASFSLSLWFQNNLAPLADVVASKYTEKEGVDITFDGSGSTDSYSDRSSLQYYWSFGDGDIGNGLTAIHRFLDNGTYGVTLRVTDRGGLTNYSNITVVITDALPTASFTPPQNPVEGVQVAFTDTSISYPDQIVSWTWEFGDGNKTYTKDATHTYMQDAQYTIGLTVVDEDGSSDKTMVIIEVADVSPRADFTVSNLSPLENTTVYFNDTSYSYPDTIDSYSWVFGDGSVEAGPSASHVSHVYLQNGSYNVTLTVTDSDGSTSKHWDTVQVQDSVPTASFEFSPSTPLEGQTVYFVDESSAHDRVVTWQWDFGDGNTSNLQTPSHEYGNNGTYDVTLIVSDGDGSTSQKTLKIIVQDTSPTVLTLITSSGLTSFDEDEIIVFRTNAIPGWESVKRYEWNFTYSNPFVPFSVTIINHTSHSYPQEGAYSVLVRVWDSDSYSEKILPIEIENVRPIANFSHSMSQTGEVMFDASISSDTPSDVSSLQFRWNFGDGTNWSPWYSDPVIRHTFVNKSREYSVVLNVRDDDGEIASKAMPVIVDTIRPVVFVLSSGQGAVVGAPITISANVTDDFGIYNVTLHYRIGDEVRNVTMSQSAADIYEGQIPSQNSSVTIFFWIQAFDNSGNSFTTGEYEIIVQTTIPLEYWYGGIGGLAMLAAGLFLGIRRYYATVDEAFIIYEDGRLIAHQTRHLKPGMDDDVLSSMLVAIQDFVKDSFKDERVTALKRLDFGEKKILVEKGDRVYLAAVLHGKHAGKIPQKMLQAIEEIQKEFGPVFAQWDGNLENMRGVKDKTQPLFKKKWTISIKRFAVLRRSPNEIGPLMIECPVCDQKIPAYSKRCPSCGVDFSSASVDDLEQVAQDMLKDENSSSRKEENTEK